MSGCVNIRALVYYPECVLGIGSSSTENKKVINDKIIIIFLNYYVLNNPCANYVADKCVCVCYG